MPNPKPQRPASPPPDEPLDEPTNGVDEASEESFPASDPPYWMGMRTGGPPPRRAQASETLGEPPSDRTTAD